MNGTPGRLAGRTGADILLGALDAEGVEVAFGLPGAKVLGIFDVLHDGERFWPTPSAAQPVGLRREERAMTKSGEGRTQKS